MQYVSEEVPSSNYRWNEESEEFFFVKTKNYEQYLYVCECVFVCLFTSKQLIRFSFWPFFFLAVLHVFVSFLMHLFWKAVFLLLHVACWIVVLSYLVFCSLRKFVTRHRTIIWSFFFIFSSQENFPKIVRNVVSLKEMQQMAKQNQETKKKIQKIAKELENIWIVHESNRNGIEKNEQTSTLFFTFIPMVGSEMLAKISFFLFLFRQYFYCV